MGASLSGRPEILVERVLNQGVSEGELPRSDLPHQGRTGRPIQDVKDGVLGRA
jgi:hypothetical protein